MRASVVASTAMFAGFLGALAAVDVGSPDAINPVIGDDSFVEAFGRAPTIHDSNLVRVRTHLSYVERTLRAVDAAEMPAELRAARRRNLDLLKRYWQTAVFPAGEHPTHRQPTFVDDGGRLCAVAYLVEATAGTEVVDRINRRFRNANIADMDDPALDAWISRSGLTRREVMMIQPNYDPRFEEWDVTRWHLLADAQAFYRTPLAMAGQGPAALPAVAGAQAKVQVIDLHLRSLAGVQGAAGRASTGETFYKGSVRVGGIPVSSRSDGRPTLLATAGAGIDGITGILPMAVTIPFGLLFSFDITGKRAAYDFYHELAWWPVVQLRAEGDYVVRGRARELAWTAGVDLVWRINRWSDMTRQRFRPRDLIASVTLTELGGTTYAGVAVGLGAWSQTIDKGVGDDSRPDVVAPPLAPYW